MIVLHPPGPVPAGTPGSPLSVTRIVRRAFDAAGGEPAAGDVASGAGEADAELRRFLVDLLAPYGQALHGQPVDRTYAGMAEQLLRPAGLLETPVDLVVLAYAVPDADPRRSPAHLLHGLLPGDPLAFAVSDQGVAAPFSALAAAGGYLRVDRFQRAVVLILEQATLPYADAQPVTLPDRASAVALVLERSGARPVVSVDHHAAVAPERVGAVLAGLVAAAPPDCVVVLGSGLAGYVEHARLGAASTARVRVASPGRWCTSVWWELADVWRDGQGVVLADYDPTAGALCVLALGSAQRVDQLSPAGATGAGQCRTPPPPPPPPRPGTLVGPRDHAPGTAR